MKNPHVLVARPAVRSLAASKIRELFNAGLGRSDILAFWVGEPDEPTPEFIRKAGMDSIAAGETFYTHNLGSAHVETVALEFSPSGWFLESASRRTALSAPIPFPRPG